MSCERARAQCAPAPVTGSVLLSTTGSSVHSRAAWLVRAATAMDGVRSPAARRAHHPRSTVNDTVVTVVGNVVDSPRRVDCRTAQRHQLPHGLHRAPVRQQTQEWVDGAHLLGRRRVLGRPGRQRVAQRQQGRPGHRRRAQLYTDSGRPSRAGAAGRGSGPWPSGPTWRGASAEFRRTQRARRRTGGAGAAGGRAGRRESADDPAGATTSAGEDYDGGSGPLYELDSERLLPGAGARLVAPGWEDRRLRTQGAGPAIRPAPPPLARRRKAPKPSGSVHLLDGPCAQGARRQGDPRRRHPGVPARRQDRRRRPQRRRQVDGPQDHGRHGDRLQRRRGRSRPAPPSACSSRSRRSTRSSTCAATSRRRSSRSATR